MSTNVNSKNVNPKRDRVSARLLATFIFASFLVFSIFGSGYYLGRQVEKEQSSKPVHSDSINTKKKCMVRKIDNQADFLAKGGALLKKDKNSAGEPVIMQKTSERDWHERLTCSNADFRDKIYNHLLSKHEKLFYRG